MGPKCMVETWLRGVLDEAWRGTLPGMIRSGATVADVAAEWRRSNRTRTKLLIVMHGIFRRAQTVYGLVSSPLARVERRP
jgi:hypothetical protein